MGKKGKVISIITLIILAASSAVYTLEVDIQELVTRSQENIEYINYTGENEFFNTADEIRGIGRNLAISIERQVSPVPPAARYAAVRVLPETASTSPGADIIIFSNNVRVDHIDNIRRIIAGYLQEGFGYDREKAWQLSEAVTIYNTVLRGNAEYFYQRYISGVREWVNSNNAGLSRNYSEWAGTTRIVIPVILSRRVTEVRDTSVYTPPAPERLDPAPVSDVSADDIQDEEYEVKVSEEEIVETVERYAEEERKAEEAAAVRVVREPEKGFAARFLDTFFRFWYLTFPMLLILLILFLLAVIFLKGKIEDSRTAEKVSLFSDRERKIIASAKNPVVMRIIYHGYLLKRKVICDVSPGEVKTVGGRGSDFYIQEVSLPVRIAEIENDGEKFIFRPLEKKYFSDSEGLEISFIGKEIDIIVGDEKHKGGKLSLLFNKYLSPMDSINRVLHSADRVKEVKEVKE